MSPEQLSFMIGSIYGSVLTLLLFRPSRRSRNKRDPFLDCRDHCSAKGPATPKPQFPPGRVTDVHGETIGYRSISSPRKP
jgi:hypothetical protein